MRGENTRRPLPGFTARVLVMVSGGRVQQEAAERLHGRNGLAARAQVDCTCSQAFCTFGALDLVQTPEEEKR
jgi:hypothetical protein